MNTALTLYIDTTTWDTATISLLHSNNTIGKNSFVAGKKLSTSLLKEIDTLLRMHGIDVSMLKNIEVKAGTGSFTGTRIGVSVANALGYALDVTVNGGVSVEPIYAKEPNITRSKKVQ